MLRISQDVGSLSVNELWNSVWRHWVKLANHEEEKGHCPSMKQQWKWGAMLIKFTFFGDLSLEDLQLLIKISRNLLVISTLTELGWKQSLPINSGQNVSKKFFILCLTLSNNVGK